MLCRANQAQRLDLLRTYKISFGCKAVLPSDTIPVSLKYSLANNTVTSAQAKPRPQKLLQSPYAGPRPRLKSPPVSTEHRVLLEQVAVSINLHRCL